jgi:hypothetical protein
VAVACTAEGRPTDGGEQAGGGAVVVVDGAAVGRMEVVVDAEVVGGLDVVVGGCVVVVGNTGSTPKVEDVDEGIAGGGRVITPSRRWPATRSPRRAPVRVETSSQTPRNWAVMTIAVVAKRRQRAIPHSSTAGTACPA